MTERGVQTAIARANMLVSWVLAWPWKRIGLSLLIAMVVVYVTKRAIIERGEKHAVGDDFDRRPNMLGDDDGIRGGADE